MTRCASCAHENRPQAKFCAGCGAALPRACGKCGAELPATARFCDACGEPAGDSQKGLPAREPGAYTPKHLAEKILTNRSALEGERKVVTVLFADVAGFTALSTRLDPEELHELMDGCFERVLEAVHRYEGTVNQFTGDGVMALFGAPIAHEDHAVRAAAAALAIQRELGQYAEHLRRERGLEFGMRIGLNTGPVVVGKIGDDLRMDYTAQGETVNLAARLQAAGSSGGVLASEATHRLVDAYFVIEDRGPLTLKGIDHPVRAFAIVAPRGRRARFELALERGLTPLTGRVRELAFLRECLERALQGQGQVVSIVGDAGAGKSRLVHELKRGLGDRPITYIEGSSLPHGESRPFQLIVEALQANFRLQAGEPQAESSAKVEASIQRLDPELAWAVPYLKHLLALPAPELEAQGLDEAQRKRRTIEAVKVFTVRGARHRPQLLVFEDLQWADPHSAASLGALVEGLTNASILLVCTYRPGFVPPWQDHSLHQRLALDALSPEEVRTMVTTLLDGREGATRLADLVVRRAAGNPLFAEELAGYLRERGTSLSGESLERELLEGKVPETIHDLLTARIDRLPDRPKLALQIASVLGREFPLALLEAVAPAGAEVRASVPELVRLELLREKEIFPVAIYGFAQPLVREVAYQGLLQRSRADLHARAGRALEELYAGRLEEVLSDLARHYARSPERGKAVHYLVRAGDRAASLFAHREAEGFYREALELAAEADGAAEPRPMILERLGDAAYAQGRIGDALEIWRDALAGLGDSERRRAAGLRWKMGGATWAAGKKDDAIAHFQEGLTALGEDLDNLEAARLYQEFGRVHFRLGDNRRATEWAERALALGERLMAADVVSHAYNTLGVAVARAGELEHGAEYLEKSLQTALGSQLAAVACRAYTNLAVMFTTLDHRRSAEYCRAGLELAEKIGDQLQQAWLYCTLAGGHCTLSGDYDAGVRAAEAAAELDERLGQRNHLPIPLIILGQIFQCRGELERSAHYYREALRIAEPLGEPQLLIPCYDGLATLAIESGDEAEADRWLATSRSLQETAGRGSDAFLVLPFLC